MLLEPGLVARWIVQRPSVWQMALVNEQGLNTIAGDRGLSSKMFGKHIKEFWRLGILRADVIESPADLTIPELTLVDVARDGTRSYADTRNPLVFENGWVEAINLVDELPTGVKLLFHPFRYYVLYHLERILKSNISLTQALHSRKGYHQLLDMSLASLEKWSRSDETLARILWWNQVAELAIAAEPHTYTTLFQVIHYPFGVDEETQQRLIGEHKAEFQEHLHAIGLAALEEVRTDLCVDAELLDPDKNLHLMLRLTRGERRLTRLRGKLGGSMYLLTMAEMIRRSAEETFEVILPEEYRLGLGVVYADAYERMYGSARIIDAGERVQQEFLREFGLDYGVRLRWYVEGQTEYAVLNAVIGQHPAIDLVNLGGQVAARRGRGVAFRESLLSDIRAHVFSFVSLDGDREDFLKAVQKAAQDDEICGAFFTSQPDFELGNFTVEELIEILWQIASDEGAPGESFESLRKAILDCQSAEQVKRRAQMSVPELSQLSKGQTWGEHLVRYAFDHPEFLNPLTGVKETRPIIEAIRLALRAVDSTYKLSRKELRVEWTTGKMVPR